MAKVTSKLQVTIPKTLADRSGIHPGDEIDWAESGDGLRIAPARARDSMTVELKLELFDSATARQKRRQRARKTVGVGVAGRGWTRADLYRDGRSR